MTSAPAIIHMMHFPWDRDHKLLDDPNQFDKDPYLAMRDYAPDFEVKLWTYPEARALCEREYPDVWKALQNVSRPVMLLDVLRWVVVHHMGGIYWQMNTTPLAAMRSYLPSPGKSVRLFTEFELTPEQCRRSASEPIRNGEPEEATRVLIQVFSAVAGAAYVKRVIDFLAERVRKHTPQKDYDILFITGNAGASTAYDRFGKDDPAVERTDLAKSKSMIKWHYRGSWRTDDKERAGAQGPVMARGPVSRSRWRGAARVYYSLFAKHPHELMAEAQDLQSRRVSAAAELLQIVRKLGVHTLCEFPCGEVFSDAMDPSIRYIGADPSRAAIRRNRLAHRGTGLRFVHIIPIYGGLPRVDLVACLGFVERVPFREASRILREIAASGARYVALTTCPLMLENFDTATGDHRPVNVQKPPFGFPDATWSCPHPDMGGRPDRTIGVWELDRIVQASGCCIAGQSGRVRNSSTD